MPDWSEFQETQAGAARQDPLAIQADEGEKGRWDTFTETGTEDVKDPTATAISETTETNKWAVSDPFQGLDDIKTRSMLGFGDTLAEKQAIFRSQYPEGELDVNDDGALVFKKEPAENWQLVDAEQKQWVEYAPDGTPTTVTDITDLPNDVAELLASDAGALGAEAAAAFIPGGGWIVKGTRAMIATYFGELAQEKIEDMYAWGPEDTWSEEQLRALGKMGATAAGVGLYKIGESVINFSTGAGILSLKPGAREALLAAKRQGLVSPTVGSVAKARFFEKLEAQSEAITGHFSEYVKAARTQVAQKLKGFTDLNAGKYLVDGRMKEALDVHRDMFIALARAKGRNMKDVGTTMLEGVDLYRKGSQNIVRDAYNAVKQYGKPDFDYTNFNQRMKEILSENKIHVMHDVQARKNIFDPRGPIVRKPLTKDLVKMSKDMREFVNDIQNLDPTKTTLDELIALRSRAYDLGMTPSKGGVEPAHSTAVKIYDALTDLMKNPRNADPAFQKAYQNAQEIALERFSTLDIINVIGVVRGKDTVSNMAKHVISRMDEQSIQTLQRVLNREEWEMVQAGYAKHLTDNPMTMKAAIENSDPAVRKYMLTKNEERDLLNIGGILEDVHVTSGLRQAVDDYTEVMEVAKAALINNKSGNVEKLLTIARNNPEAKTAMRAGIFEYVMEASLRYTKKEADKEIQSVAIKKLVDDVLRGPTGKLLETRDKVFLRDISKVVHFYNASNDIQASLAGGAIVSRAAHLDARAFLAVLRVIGIGNVMTTKTFQRIAVGWGDNIGIHKHFPKLHLTTRMATQAHSNYGNFDGKEEAKKRKSNVN